MAERLQTEHGDGDSSIKTLLAAAAINIVIMAVLLLLFYPAFETNDDSGLEGLVTGSRGIRDPHMVYANYILGLILTTLFRIAPGIQWTAVLQYAILFLSFTSTTYVFFTRLKSLPLRALVTSVIFFFSFEGYICIQYTKTAGIMTAAGLLLVFFGLSREKDKLDKCAVVIGSVLTLLGSLYRIQQALLGIALFSALVLYCGVNFFHDLEKPGKRMIQSVVLGSVIVLLIGGLFVFDRAQYSGKEWSDYLEFDKYRAEVLDYGIPKYSEHKQEYKEIGIDKTAYNLMKRWVFEDEERFTADTFRQISELREKKTINKAFVKEFLVSSVKGLLKENCFICFALIFFCWLIIGKRRWMELVSILLLLLVLAAFYFYFFYAGRFMIHRVDAGVWFTASLIMLFMFDEENKSFIPAVAGVLIIMLFAVRVPWADSLRINSQDQIDAARSERNIIKQINTDQDHLYLTKVGTMQFSKAYGVFDAIPFCSGNNMYPLGGWTAETPTYKAVLKKYGVQNPFKEMVNNDKVFIVDTNIDLTLDYIRKWYYPKAEAELIDVAGSYKIYRIRAEAKA